MSDLVNKDLTGGKQGGRMAVNDEEYRVVLDCISVILLGYAKQLREKGELE